MSSENSQFDNLEQTLEAFQENARQLAVIASDFQPKSQDALNQKLQTLITGLQVCHFFKLFIHLVTDFFMIKMMQHR